MIKETNIHVGNGCSAITRYEYQSNLDEDLIWLNEVNPAMFKLCELESAHRDYNPKLDDIFSQGTFKSIKRHNDINEETLAENWCIGPIKARSTLEATTQNFKRSAILPISRRYRADRFYKTKRLEERFATDTIWADTKSLNQHKFAQAYTHKCGFAVVYPMNNMSGDSIGETLQHFVHDFGIPSILTFDGHKSQVSKGSLFMKMIRKYDIKFHVSEPRKPQQNPAEGGIREIKRRWYRIMTKKAVPKRLWDYGLVWICETGNLTVSSSRYANNRTGLEIISGETPDISEYVDFGFYDWVSYRANAGLGELEIGRWLGVSHKVGQLMSYWILTISAKVISCTTVQRLTQLEKNTDEWSNKMRQYDEKIQQRIENVQGTSINVSEIPHWNRLSMDEYDTEFIEEFKSKVSDDSIPEADDQYGEVDNYINMKLNLHRGGGDEIEYAEVKRRAIDRDGKPIGKSNKNPILDTRAYEVEYIDGTTEILPANIIAENILAQVDTDGHTELTMEEIIDHRMNNNEIAKEQPLTDNRSGKSIQKPRTTKGWDLYVQWKGGHASWVALKDMKHGYPVQTAKYAIKKGLDKEPAFNWWVSYTMRKADRIISKLKSKYWQRTHKYGIQIPKSAEEAYEIDKANANKLWTDAIREEMTKIKGAVRVYEGDPKELKGYQQITGHIIFDIKLGEGFRRKARFVGDGHKTETPNSVTYSSVVLRDSVRIILMIAALNELDIEGADIENAYLTAPCREKFWMRVVLNLVN